MDPMIREKMVKELTDFCQSKPIDGCKSCEIRRILPAGYGCIKVKDRTDEQLAADVERLPKKEQPIVKEQKPERLHIKYMVAVERDVITRIQGGLVMLAASVDDQRIVDQLMQMNAAIQYELDNAAEADAEEKLIRARADAEAVKIAADAEAYRLEMESKNITDAVIQKETIEKWDGKLPSITGSDSVPLVNAENLIGGV